MSIAPNDSLSVNLDFQTPNIRNPEFINSFHDDEAESAIHLTRTVNFKEMFESLSVMFYIENFDPVYELEYISPAFECLGYTLEEIYADPKILDFLQRQVIPRHEPTRTDMSTLPTDVLAEAANIARGLAIDAVHKCSSGHLGLPQ